MLLFRSPTLLFALIFAIFSMGLTTITVHLGLKQTKYHIQFLIIFPPLNSIFLFLCSVTWIERRFRLSYMPFICLTILFISSLTLTIVSSLLLSLSLIIYFNFIFYAVFAVVFFLIILTLSLSYVYGLFRTQRSDQPMNTDDESIDPSSKMNQDALSDQIVLKSAGNGELTLYMATLPIRRRSHLKEDLHRIHVDLILTLNETKELPWVNMSRRNSYQMELRSVSQRRRDTEHLFYPIRNRFIPKSISDYIQFLYSIITNLTRSNRHRVLVHSMDGLGRTGMTVACFDLLYEYILNSAEQRNQQTLIERVYHYPFLFENSCRACQAIAKVRRARAGSLQNPLQNLFVHEFYARLKSPSYMKQIKDIINLNEKLFSNTLDELRVPPVNNWFNLFPSIDRYEESLKIGVNRIISNERSQDYLRRYWYMHHFISCCFVFLLPWRTSNTSPVEDCANDAYVCAYVQLILHADSNQMQRGKCSFN